MRKATQKKEVATEVPDNTVFWSVVGIVCIFIVVLAAVMLVKNSITGQIVTRWEDPTTPFSIDPYACLDVPPCKADQSYMCCAEFPLPGTGQKCTQPFYGRFTSEGPRCPEAMPNRCTCPEKFQYRQTWPVPTFPTHDPRRGVGYGGY